MPLTRRSFHHSLLAGGAALATGPAVALAPPSEGGGKWYRLFDGKTLAGWTPKIVGEVLGEDRNQTFRVADGLLQVRYDNYSGFSDKFGHLFFNEPLSTYRLRIEYRFVSDQCKGGPDWGFRNSGVIFHAQDPELMDRDQWFPVGLEMTLLGGDGTNPRATGGLCTPGTHVVYKGNFYTVDCSGSSSKTFHGDQWVTAEIEVHGGGRIIHRINDEEVFSYEQPRYDPNHADAKKLIPGDLLALEGGMISLQSDSHPVDFRKVELMPLD
ncbi:MAG: 3-keto-disaccharide hydrolase [Planctomycetia bacterium]